MNNSKKFYNSVIYSTNRFFISTTVSAKWADPPSFKSNKKYINNFQIRN